MRTMRVLSVSRKTRARPVCQGMLPLLMASLESESVETPSTRVPSWGVIAVAAAIVVVFMVHRSAWEFLCDDAYISFRYAKNWAEHGELVFNTHPLERVEGYTNFLFVVLLSLGHGVKLAPHQLAPWLNAGGSLACLGLVTLLMRALRERGRSRGAAPLPLLVRDLLPASLLVLMPEFMVWSSSGLEGSVALALGLSAVVAWLGGRPVWAAGFAMLAALCREDSLLWIASFGVAYLLVEGLEARRRGQLTLSSIVWRRLAVASVVFAVPLLAHLLWRQAYYGAWLPNTWTVKQSGMLLRDTWGQAYVEFWARNLHLLFWVPLVVMLRLRHLLWVLPCLSNLAYAWWMGGDFMAYSRFLLPATVFFVVLISCLLCDVERRLKRRASWFALLWCALVCVIAAQIPERLKTDHREDHIGGRWESVSAMDRFARIRVAAGTRMRQELSPDTRVSVGAAGAMPYTSELQAYDSYGLIDAGVAQHSQVQRGKRARPGHQLHASLSYMRAKKLDLFCHLGTDWTRKPSAKDARRRGFSRGSWACFETGSLAGRGGISRFFVREEPVESRFYCCLQPQTASQTSGEARSIR